VIGKITGGASFGGALDYLMKPKEPKQEQEKELYKERLKDAQRTPGEPAPEFEAGERHRIIGGNMSDDIKGELTEEFRAISRQRPDIEKPVHHASLSAGENDKISVEQWNEIAEKYVQQMGFGDAPYVVIQHRDGKTDHIHILTSRVDLEGKVVSDWKCKERAEKVLRGIEKEYGLEQVKPSREVERAAPKRGELERFNRTGELSAKMSLQGHVQDALKDTPTATQFIEKLQSVGVEVIPYIGKEGRAIGISFRKGKQLMKGSDLGRGFSWPALQERGLDYNPERDRPAIETARLRADTAPAKAVEVPTISTPAPEYGLTDFVK
jgi:Relaxase/Mobilisation nuclease domain